MPPATSVTSGGTGSSRAHGPFEDASATEFGRWDKVGGRDSAERPPGAPPIPTNRADSDRYLISNKQ
jgi:hypothetical protein